MNTSSLKKFAVSAREKLMNGVADKILALGFDKKGNVEEKNVPQRIQGGAVFMERASLFGKFGAFLNVIKFNSGKTHFVRNFDYFVPAERLPAAG